MTDTNKSKLTPDETQRALNICKKYPWYKQVIDWHFSGYVTRREIADGVMWLESRNSSEEV